MYNIAHRGYSIQNKGNTLECFKNAVQNKFDMIELDIQLTKDNHIIVYHDTYINDEKICNMKLFDIQQFDPTIMTLNDFFNHIDYLKTSIYLDVKGDHFICIYLHKFLNTIKKDNILIGSFDFIVLETLYKLDNTYNLGLITSNNMNNTCLQYFIDNLNIAFICYHWSVLNNNAIKYLHNKNVLVFSYTCDNRTTEKIMRSYDLDGIVSDYKL